MPNLLISLVGDQTVPNVFLIRDAAFRRIDHYIFVTTQLMEERRRLAHIIAATGISEEQYHTITVEADQLADIRHQLSRLQLPLTGNHYYVNLTSGTKLMSIALYDFFTREGYQNCSSIFYVPIGKNAFLQVYPEGQRREEAISYRISLGEYLASYGIEALEQKGTQQLYLPPAYTASAFPHFLKAMDTGKAFANRMKGLRDRYRQASQKAELQIRVEPEMQSFLGQIGFPLSREGTLEKAAVAYLIGGWLEEWLYMQVKEGLGLPDAAIRFGVKVARPNASGERVPNECDLLFILNNTLYIVECKTGLGRSPKPLFEEAVYKLTALRNEFGQRVQTLFFTLTDLRDTKGRLRKPYLDRAGMHRIRLFDRQGIAEGLEGYLREEGERSWF